MSVSPSPQCGSGGGGRDDGEDRDDRDPTHKRRLALEAAAEKNAKQKRIAALIAALKAEGVDVTPKKGTSLPFAYPAAASIPIPAALAILKKDKLLLIAGTLNLSTSASQSVPKVLAAVLTMRERIVAAEADATIVLPSKRAASTRTSVPRSKKGDSSEDDEEPTAAQTSQEDEGEAQALAALAFDEEDEQPVAVEAPKKKSPKKK